MLKIKTIRIEYLKYLFPYCDIFQCLWPLFTAIPNIIRLYLPETKFRGSRFFTFIVDIIPYISDRLYNM